MAPLTFNLITGTSLYSSDCTPGEVGSDSPQVLFYFTGPTPPPPTMLLADSWQQPGYYIFIDSALTDPSQFAESLQQNLSGLEGARFLWISNPNDTTDPLNIIALTVQGGQTGPPSTFQFRNNMLVIGQGCTITPDSDNNQFAIAQPSGVTDRISYQVSGSTLSSAVGATVYLPLCGAASGCFQFELTLIDEYLGDEYLDVALRYFRPDPGGRFPESLVSQRYPLLTTEGQLTLVANIDPLDLTNAARTYFSFTEDAPPVDSYFRTNVGLEVQLTPQSNAALVFAANSTNKQADPNDPLYLVPSGDFQMSTVGSNSTQQGNAAHGPRLICGLGGNEYFDVGPAAGGNIISFTPGCAAFIPYLPNQQSGMGTLDPSATTSWVTMKPAAGGAANYYAQPQNAELYATGFPSGSTSSSSDGGGGPELLGFLEVPAIALSVSAPPGPYPLVPYAGVEISSLDADAISAIESGVLSPARRATLGYAGPDASLKASVRADVSAPPNSTTPQGLLANVSGPVMNSLVLGQSDDGIQLTLDVLNSTGMQAALQSNKQFIVVTDLNAAKFIQSQVSIGGWTFDFDPPKSGTPPVGTYYNVLMLKYYDATIEDLAANTTLWTNGDIFNANLQAASEWLVAYIKDAKDQYTAGNMMFQSFVDLVTDPTWNGILGLNLYIPPGNLPSEVQGLLGGIDLSKFSAHHFGVETNSTGSNFSLIKSSLFAMINYENPATGDSPAAGDYGFQVLTLQVVFANSEITDFNSEIQVTINNLFNATANLSTGSGNAVTLRGSYESHDGATSYSFATTSSFVFNLDSKIIQSVTFDKVQFTTVSSQASGGGGDDLEITSTFSFWGSITFGSLLNFDLFSFDDLAFAGLSLSFTFNPSTLNSSTNLPIQSFTFDPGNIRFDISISQARQSSLLGNFPLRLTGFTYASAGVSIQSLGYLPIQTALTPTDTVVYALMFTLDLGSIGALAAPLKGFSADLVAGWNPSNDGEVGFGIKLPVSSGGKLQIGIEGVLLLTINNFEFTTLEKSSTSPQRYVLYMHECTLGVFGTTIPPSGTFSFLFFAPTGSIGGSIGNALSNLGWFVAYQQGGGGGDAPLLTEGDNGDGGGSSILQLSYLGLGQRVQVPGGFDDANTVSEVLATMSDKLLPNKTGSDLNDQLAQIYDKDAGWIVGGQFTLLETLTLGAAFYDPSLYGVLLGIAPGKLGPLGGFNFEILYKKVTDTIGVYEIQLTLPDYLRQLNFGEVIITIPVIGVDIYTNGNFKIDVGFPNGTDFSNSLMVQVFPFLGAGGFYFAVLSEGTATNVPQNLPGGQLNPVLEFGFGLSLGVGAMYNEGILSAGLAVMFVGILEGTVAYWVPDDTGSGIEVMFDRAPDYYQLSGQIAIVGTLYGVVDFGIVKASLTVTISAGATLVWEAYQSLVLGVYAQVSVSLVVVIGGFKIFGHRIEIKIKFSFSAKVSYTWTIPDNRIPPWGTSASLSAARFAALPGSGAGTGPIAWSLIQIYSPTTPVQLWFSPQVTVAQPPGASSPAAQFVALLTMNTTPASGSGFSDFDNLAGALLAWAISLYGSQSSYDTNLSVSADTLQGLSTLLSTNGTTVNDGAQPLDYQNLSAFLAANFTASITDTPATTDDSASQETTIFPMIPDLILSATGLSQGINYSQAGMVPTTYMEDLAEYFAMLLVNYNASQSQSGVATNGNSEISMATVIFQDYFALIIKAAISQAIQYVSTLPGSTTTLGALLTGLQGQGGFVNVAAQASRFLLHGLSLPASFPEDQSQWPALATQPLYQLVQQQIALEPVSTSSTISGTGATSTSFNGSAALSSVDAFYVGYIVTFTTGALAGTSQTVSAYTGATQALAVASGFAQAPAAGDQFLLTAYAVSAVAGASPTASSFSGAATISAVDSAYDGYMVTFTGGALGGQFSTITGYTGAIQQLTVSPAFSQAPAVGDEFVITPFVAGLTIDAAAVSPWYSLSAETPPTFYMDMITTNALATIETLVATAFAPVVNVTQLPNLSQQPRSYSLQRSMNWQLVDDSTTPPTVEDTWTICPFPSTLTQQLASGTLPDLTLMTGTPGSNTPPTVPAGLASNWATIVNLSVQQIPGAGGGFLSNTYQVGGTDETGRDLIFDLLTQLNSGNPPQIDNIYLVFQGTNEQGLVSETIIERSSTVLMKVNLSTESAPPSTGVSTLMLTATAEPPADDYSAMMDQYAGFLRLIWECSIVNAGGYYLYYLNSIQGGNNGLPSYLFSNGTTAQVSLLVTFAAGAAVAAYNNAVVVTDQGSSPGTVFFAQASSLLDWKPTIAAGSIAFGLTTPPPPDDDSEQNQLLNLFNLLTYQIQANATFEISMQGLPVGPVDPADGSPPSDWSFQQGVSVTPWYNTNGQGTNQDPYAGVGSQVEMNFALRDLFGNAMPTTTPLPTLTADYLYFDNLIPVNTWSGVRTSYLCSLVGTAGMLEVTLAFDGSGFMPSSSAVNDTSPTAASFHGGAGLSNIDNAYKGMMIAFTSGQLVGQQSTVSGYTAAGEVITVSPPFSQAPANGDSFVIFDQQRATQLAETYELIQYQLTGAGVSISLATSLAPGVVTAIPATQFTAPSTGFVAGIIAFLQGVASGTANPAQPPPLIISVPISLAQREANANNIYEVTVALTIERDSSLVDPSVNTVPPGGGASLALMAVSAISPQVGSTETTAVTGSPTTTSFSGGSNLSSIDNYYLGGNVSFSTGALSGLSGVITGYVGATRTITVQPAFSSAPAVGDALSVTPKLTLTPFAQDFEAAFTEMRVATGLGSAGPLSIWAMRIGAIQAGNNGLQVSIDSSGSIFFAPKPLANSLVSRPDATNPDPVQVVPYQSGVDNPTPVAMTFSGVDLDVFARSFLLAIDQFLGAGIAVPARQLNSEYYLAVITAKEALAAEIAMGVTNVLETTDQVPAASLAAAQEAFKQRLLVTLGSDYDISTIVQYPATVTASGTEEPVAPNLYGQVLGALASSPPPNEPPPNFSLSTSSVPLATSGSLLTCLFNMPADQAASVDLSLQYQVTHIEHDISQTSGPEGYTASSWLTLVTSNSAGWPAGNVMPVGQASVPIPLRAYPTPPSLLGQSAEAGASDRPDAGGGSVTLASQRLWHYSCQYQQDYIPQDTIGTNIQFNTPSSGSSSSLFADAVENPDLFYWLARFSYEYPLMRPDLAKIPSAQPGDPVVTYAMLRFAQLVWGAAFGTALPATIPSDPPDPTTGPWALWVTGQQGPALRSRLLGVGLEQYQYTYQVEEVNPTSTTSSIVLTAGDASYPYPDILIQNAAASVAGSNPSASVFNGDSTLPAQDNVFVNSQLTFTTGTLAGESSTITAYAGSTKTITVSPAFASAPAVGDQFVIDALIEPAIGSESATYPYGNPEPSSSLVRTLVFNNLDVMSTENAWGGVQLSRNMVLVDTETTNPEFVYQTPIVRFVNTVTPILDSNDPVNIAQIQTNPSSTPLEYYLCVLMEALFAASNADSTGTRTIRVGCSYAYGINGAADADASPLMVSVPVLLYPPFPFDLSELSQDCTTAPPSGSFVYALGQAIRTWFSGYSPSTPGGVLTFDISVFAGLTQTNLPVLRLRNLFLNYSDIDPPLGGS